jgi:hypothetical protein
MQLHPLPQLDALAWVIRFEKKCCMIVVASSNQPPSCEWLKSWHVSFFVQNSKMMPPNQPMKSWVPIPHLHLSGKNNNRSVAYIVHNSIVGFSKHPKTNTVTGHHVAAARVQHSSKPATAATATPQGSNPLLPPKPTQ